MSTYDDNDVEDDLEGIEIDTFCPLTDEEDNILYTTYEGPRAVVLNNSSFTLILCTIMQESDDSFLVRMPAKMITEDNSIKATSFVLNPSVRLLKSSILMVTDVREPFLTPYMDYLKTEGIKYFPDLEQEIFTSNEISDNTKPEKTMKEDLVFGPGLTEEEYSDKMQDAKKNGNLILYDNSFKVKH